MLLEKLRLLECSLHGDRRNDPEWLELILHPEFREITLSGVTVDRSETIASLLSEKAAPYILSSDFCLRRWAAVTLCFTIGRFTLMAAIMHYVPLAGFVRMRASGLCFFTTERRLQAMPGFRVELHT